MWIEKAGNIMIHENDKIRLNTGEIARVSEVLKENTAYIVEIYRQNNGVSVTVEQILHDEIESVFIESEMPLAQVV